MRTFYGTNAGAMRCLSPDSEEEEPVIQRKRKIVVEEYLPYGPGHPAYENLNLFMDYDIFCPAGLIATKAMQDAVMAKELKARADKRMRRWSRTRRWNIARGLEVEAVLPFVPFSPRSSSVLESEPVTPPPTPRVRGTKESQLILNKLKDMGYERQPSSAINVGFAKEMEMESSDYSSDEDDAATQSRDASPMPHYPRNNLKKKKLSLAELNGIASRREAKMKVNFRTLNEMDSDESGLDDESISGTPNPSVRGSPLHSESSSRDSPAVEQNIESKSVSLAVCYLIEDSVTPGTVMRLKIQIKSYRFNDGQPFVFPVLEAIKKIERTTGIAFSDLTQVALSTAGAGQIESFDNILTAVAVVKSLRASTYTETTILNENDLYYYPISAKPISLRLLIPLLEKSNNPVKPASLPTPPPPPKIKVRSNPPFVPSNLSFTDRIYQQHKIQFPPELFDGGEGHGPRITRRRIQCIHDLASDINIKKSPTKLGRIAQKSPSWLAKGLKAMKLEQQLAIIDHDDFEKFLEDSEEVEPSLAEYYAYLDHFQLFCCDGEIILDCEYSEAILTYHKRGITKGTFPKSKMPQNFTEESKESWDEFVQAMQEFS